MAVDQLSQEQERREIIAAALKTEEGRLVLSEAIREQVERGGSVANDLIYILQCSLDNMRKEF